MARMVWQWTWLWVIGFVLIGCARLEQHNAKVYYKEALWHMEENQKYLKEHCDWALWDAPYPGFLSDPTGDDSSRAVLKHRNIIHYNPKHQADIYHEAMHYQTHMGKEKIISDTVKTYEDVSRKCLEEALAHYFSLSLRNKKLIHSERKRTSYWRGRAIR